MSDPKRWREEPDAPAGIGELLESARVDEPSVAQLAKLRLAIGFLIVPPGGGGGGGGHGGGGSSPPSDGGLTGSGSAAATGVVGKTVAIGLATLVVAGLGGSVLLRTPAVKLLPAVEVTQVTTPPPIPTTVDETPEPSEPSAPAVVAAPLVPAPRPRPVALAPQPSEPGARKDTPPVPAPAPVAAAPNGEDEVGLLQEAMSAAQSGRSADALAAVDGHVRAFPSSPLAQEREAIAIEALVNLGRMPEAKTRIEKFRAAWPTSTHLLRLESLIH